MLNKKHFPQKNLAAKVISPGEAIPQPAGVAQPGASDVGGRVRFGRVRVGYGWRFFWSNPAFLTIEYSVGCTFCVAYADLRSSF
jgi:hypothetical protein